MIKNEFCFNGLSVSVLLISIFIVVSLLANPAIAMNSDWSKRYPNSNGRAKCVIATDDGYVFAGVSNGNFLLAKAGLAGELVWWKTYQKGEATCVIQTSDGGFAIAGWGDVNFIKTDNSGNLQWSKSYTYSNETYKVTTFRVESMAQTPEGGYILAGKTPSGLLGWDWTIKIDADGNVLWGKTYGTDWGNSLARNVLAVDDGYILAANRLIYKIDQDGNVLWSKPANIAGSLVQTADGGYLLVVSTGSGGDYELIKTDSDGNTLWNKTYRLESAVETHLRLAIEDTDGGFIVCASVYPHWEGVAWIVKTDPAGNPLWNITSNIVSDYNSNAYSLIEAGNGEYVYCGAIVNVNRSNDTSVWLAKASAPYGAPTITPTPTSTEPTPSPTFIAEPSIQSLHAVLIGASLTVAVVAILLYTKREKHNAIKV